LNPVADPAAPSGWETPATDDQTQVSPAVNADAPADPLPSEPAQAEQAIEPTGDTEEQLEESQPGAPTTSWSWGHTASSQAKDDEPIANDVTDAFDAGDAATAEADDSSERQTLSSWASQWSGLSAEEPRDDDESSRDEVVESEAIVSEAESSEVTAPETVLSDSNIESGEVAAPEAIVSDSEPEDVIEPVAPAEIYNDEEFAIAAAPAVEEDRSAGDESPQARAHALLDELRDLIDASVKEPEPEPAPGTDTSTAENDGTSAALATLTAIPTDASRFDNLRAILEKAREHPRDVDTMLDLLGEINTLIALIDSHEVHVDAVSTAIAQLRGEA
jgi:hypothetical protein